MGLLEQAMNDINKQYPGSIMRLGKCAYTTKNRVSTGSFALDMAIGGGIPEGSIVEIFGPLSSGKSFVSLKMIAEMQKLGRKAAILDLENSLDIKWCKKIGINTDDLIVSQPSSAEQAIDTLDKLVNSRELGIIVIDSIASMVPMVELETDAIDQQMGVAARLTNKMVRKVQSALQPKDLGDEESYNKCIVVFINQIRMKIGVMFGSPETTPGGKGVGFAADIRVRLSRKEWIQEKNDAKKKTGQIVAFTVKKNKTYPPFKVGVFNIYFKTGSIGNYTSLIQYGIFYDFIKKGGSSYAFDKKKFRGKQALIKYLTDNPKLTKQLKNSIRNILFK